ncbi:TaqI-like C-terminal specificity domain-containing protein [Cloacibacillus sp. An23]|uniref:TaqI-like C-terminal specificity domain-containing protein n=1 Tax=Cloacibacillus sp. An23 TaxID=1965591 RepID=UPI000B3B02DA|nr:TaqI-like C-terminal specificity domain-containing protein [Cloacibacillus sp. An23]OUO94303.1 hypothetical protein B5F39_03520 [Cloacibacillus sp. An23]
MIYNYNKLWQLLINNGMTKTQMRQSVGISANLLAKMGRNEPVSLNSLAKICTTLNCGLNDIIEIIEDNQTIIPETIRDSVSDATVRNWEKLKTTLIGRLTTRANKRKSQKRFIPLEYNCNKDNIPFVQGILEYIDANNLDIMSSMYSLGISLLNNAKIYNKQHVKSTLKEYEYVDVVDELTRLKIPDDEFDILGLIYQSYLQEGQKNIIGSYYTPQRITHNLTSRFDFSNGELFLDPCCGSGAFLLSVKVKNPNQIYGIDNDKIAVLISKINILLKYKDIEFIPHIYCLDFLMGNSITQRHPVFEKRFDYIATNPPWGAMRDNYKYIETITSKETFSYFFVRAYAQLKKGGIIRFLFPQAILNVKIHKDIRKFILNTAKLASITIYDDMFSSVTTKYVDIECGSNANNEIFYMYTNTEKRAIAIKTVYETENLIFNLLSYEDISIIQCVKNKGKFSLTNSTWALGIVTGDNKGKLSSKCFCGMEKIYTGKEIQPYFLSPAKNYILYDRANLQQVAKEEIYRAPEKLVYKFISNKLVFAYDDSASLFLNSANILIPAIPSMGIKTVMAFLNSTLYQFLYIKLFGEVKILKGNLNELPFPEITQEENDNLTLLVDEVLSGNRFKREVIDNYIFSIYGLSGKQITYIRSVINGKFN